ncbi:MAG: SufB/SufD family protein [Shimia sp.]
MAVPATKTDLTEAMLDRHARPEGGSWLSAARDAAERRFQGMGAPVRRDEYWRYTNPQGFTGDDVPSTVTETPASFDNALTLVFVDGVFDPEASDAPEMKGVTVERLADVAMTDLHWAKALYGVLEGEGHFVSRPLAALNTARAADGVLIHATGSPARPIRISYRSTGGCEAMLHHVVKVDAGASVTLLEEGLPGARANTAIEADIADTGTFHHLRLQGPEADRATAAHTFLRLGAAATGKSFCLTANGTLTRNETVVAFTGDDAVAHVAGAALGDGAFHHDDTVFVTHDAVNCESRQVFKKVLRNGAVGVFQGKILVKEGAQKTDGYQISQSLLLDDDSQFLAKPELEIYADDVACSHGSTSGAIDEEGLFYLRSRGVPHREAVDLMTLAFLAEVLAEIEDEGLAEQVQAQLETWLRG